MFTIGSKLVDEGVDFLIEEGKEISDASFSFFDTASSLTEAYQIIEAFARNRGCITSYDTEFLVHVTHKKA